MIDVAASFFSRTRIRKGERGALAPRGQRQRAEFISASTTERKLIDPNDATEVRWTRGAHTPRSPGLLWLACLLTLCFTTGALAADSDISVALESTPLVDPSHGYSEYRFVIRNVSRSESHEVEISLPATPSYGQGMREITRRVTVGADSTVRLSLLQPALSLNGFEAGVTVDGRRRRDTITLSGSRVSGSALWSYSRGSVNPNVLVSQGVPGAFLAAKDAALPSTITPSPPAGSATPGAVATASPIPQLTLNLVRSPAATSQWSDQWLSYSSYDAIVVSAAEWSAMPPQVREALTTYLQAGGVLLVLGGNDLPQAWREATASEPVARVDGGGFGVMLAAQNDAFRETEKSNWATLLAYASATPAPWSGAVGNDLNSMFPIVQNTRIPARGMMVMMILFAIIIGPVNMFVLSKKNRRIWMLWTVPTISFVTSLGVFAYAMFSEGIKPQVRIAQITLLDEGARRATTVGLLGVYCPLTPGNGLEFDTQTEVTPIVADWYSPSDRSIDWTSGQRLTTGWVAARTPTHLLVRNSQTRRERLTIEPGTNDTEITVVNGLGVPITQLTVKGKSGQLFAGSNIAPGARASLTAVPSSIPTTGITPLRNVGTYGWANAAISMSNEPTLFLAPGCYIAQLADTVFLDDGLGHAAKRNVLSVVYGVPENAKPVLPASLRRNLSSSGEDHETSTADQGKGISLEEIFGAPATPPAPPTPPAPH